MAYYRSAAKSIPAGNPVSAGGGGGGGAGSAAAAGGYNNPVIPLMSITYVKIFIALTRIGSTVFNMAILRSISLI